MRIWLDWQVLQHFRIASAVIGILWGVIVVSYVSLMQSVKKEVHKTPKIPMHFCPHHGVYPEKYTLTITVPELDDKGPPLAVPMCPFCYDEKMKAAEKVFKT